MSVDYNELVEMIGQRKAVKVLREDAERKKVQAFNKHVDALPLVDCDPVVKEAWHEG